MTNPPGAVISGGEIPCTSRLGGEQGAEDLGVGPSSSLAVHECAQGCPFLTHSASEERRVPFSLYTVSIVSLLAGASVTALVRSWLAFFPDKASSGR